ncbi:MAG: OmpA family protein [Cyclobacteriaceae bacterium]|jgi:outer membrane protein OmpA-like peptidoglycan-associated protein|nr:OmpA family protein [Cyclobacteriaceae bacterium]
MRSIATFLLMTAAGIAAAQPADTLIHATGMIFNAATKEPVVAKISYQSLPYGNRIGFLNGSSFTFPMYDNEKYAVVIEAPGFAVAKYMLDPAVANGERKVVQNIELALPSAAAHNAETVHTVGKVMRLDNLIFGIGNAKITADSYPELDEVAVMLHNNPKMVIQLEGHTDVKGDPKLNMKLSQDRVTAVKSYLIGKGVHKGKIKTKAYGGTRPVTRENTEDAHKLNRRVEVRILEN